jgi:tRNA pseudouridine55 synthase
MFLLIDKPKGITSHDVVDKIRKITGAKKVGHAGTLDPNATGLLIIGVGRESTKRLGDISKNTMKVYVAEIFLGEERDTGDVEGNLIGQSQLKPVDISKQNLIRLLNSFLGEQEQVPPKYSAKKIKGRKAYELAREGKEPKLKPRKVVIYSIKLIKYEYPILTIKTEVSSGTYIRALARDIGEELGCGAYLKNLRRSKIGKFTVEQAIKLNEINPKRWKEHAFDLQ